MSESKQRKQLRLSQVTKNCSHCGKRIKVFGSLVRRYLRMPVRFGGFMCAACGDEYQKRFEEHMGQQ